jgi:hypothetical protein
MVDLFLKNIHLNKFTVHINDWYDGIVCGIYLCHVTNSEFAVQLAYWDVDKKIKVYQLAQIKRSGNGYENLFHENRFNIDELYNIIVSDVYVVYTSSGIEAYLRYEKFAYSEFKTFKDIDEIVDQSNFEYA